MKVDSFLIISEGGISKEAIDWYAIDAAGQLARFYSTGSTYIPKQVFADRGAYDDLANIFDCMDMPIFMYGSVRRASKRLEKPYRVMSTHLGEPDRRLVEAVTNNPCLVHFSSLKFKDAEEIDLKKLDIDYV